MRQVTGDFGEKSSNLPVKATPNFVTRSYSPRRGALGRMPESYRSKSYMVLGRYEDELLLDYGHTMGWGFPKIKFKMPRIKINVKKFISSIGKAFQSIVDLVKDTIEAAKKVVRAITPPALHKYIDIIVDPLPLITNPVATVTKLIDPRPLIELVTNPIPQIKHVLDPAPKIAAVNYVYKNVLKPTYKMVANATAELALKPVNNVLDETVYKVLPSHLAEKLEKITDLPEQAARGKITADVLREAAMAAVQVGATSFAVNGYISNSILDWARKDAILGGVMAKLDQYSGGLLTSFQNLQSTGGEIYNGENIDWKRKILDGVKIYLAATGASAFAQAMAANYVGTQTGLNKTPIGRDVLTAGRIYLTASYTDAGFEFTNAAAREAGKAVLTETAKREIIIEAAKKGIIDKKTLEDMVQYGSALYGAQNEDGTFNSEQMVSIAKDGAYQEFIREEVRKRTGLDLSLADLSEIYGYAMNPQEILDNVNAAIDKAYNDMTDFEKNIEDAYEKALEDYEDFDLDEFIKNEMPRFEQNVKDELARYADGHVDDFIKWVISKIGPEKAKDPRNFTPELLTEYETTVLDLTGQSVPKKKALNPMVIGAGLAIMAGAAFLITED